MVGHALLAPAAHRRSAPAAATTALPSPTAAAAAAAAVAMVVAAVAAAVAAVAPPPVPGLHHMVPRQLVVRLLAGAARHAPHGPVAGPVCVLP